MQQEVELLGITRNDIQEIFTKTLRDFKQSKTRVIYLDASYLYNFHLDEFPEVRKFNLLGRYYSEKLKALERVPKQARNDLWKKDYKIAKTDNKKYLNEWHICLERWYADQTVILGGNKIKPIQIERSFDRMVNEGMKEIAEFLAGGGSGGFVYRMIGDGDFEQPLPSDFILANEINRINVLDNPDGGSLSNDGSTVYSIGNHPKSVASTDVTECGIADTDRVETDIMLDHSKFEDPVTHVQNADAIGSTTVIYMCSA